MAKNGSHDIMDVVEGRITLDEFVSELSIDDLIHLLGGQPNTGVANTFGIGNMPEYGIPSVMTADGPAGVRIAPEVGICTTAFPCSTLLACTWNPDVLEAVGRAGGEELKENNLALWLTLPSVFTEVLSVDVTLSTTQRIHLSQESSQVPWYAESSQTMSVPHSSTLP